MTDVIQRSYDYMATGKLAMESARCGPVHALIHEWFDELDVDSCVVISEMSDVVEGVYNEVINTPTINAVIEFQCSGCLG